LHDTARHYRRALWHEQADYVEVWLEKDALAGVLYDVTGEWDVPLMVVRGYSSLSFLHSAGEAIAAYGKRTFIYYFGDYDPSGVDIARKVEAGLREFAPTVEIHFERVAVTPAQITLWNLPTRPTKKTDSRSKHFQGESVEVDAIPPQDLRDLAETCIVQHLDMHVMERVANEERLQRFSLGCDLVATMLKPAPNVFRVDCLQGFGEGVVQQGAGASSTPAQERFELGPAGFDGREVR